MQPARQGPFCVFIGDDFTGASDTLASWAPTGARVRLFLDATVAAGAASDLDVIGIATGLRGLPADRIAGEMAGIAASLCGLRPKFVHYKICSTFDSAPATGSIGAAVRELEIALNPALTLVIGGQPSLGRYCLFGHLFARAADGHVYRIDRHPVMRRHPVTPMTESDLSVHLAAQGLEGLQKIGFTQLAEGADALGIRLRTGMSTGQTRFLLDAATSGDIVTVGQALGAFDFEQPVLIIGASSVAEALSSILPETRKARSSPSAAAPSGACLVVAGSQSSVTEAQVAQASLFAKHPLRPEILHDASALERLVSTVCEELRQFRPVLVHSLPGADYQLDASALTERLVGFVASVAAEVKIGRLGIAGGDTSSAICQRLGFASIGFETDIDPGVGLCSGSHDDPALDGMRLMLKGGQMGAADLFDRFASL